MPGGSRGHRWTCRSQPGADCIVAGQETKRKETAAAALSPGTGKAGKLQPLIKKLEVSPNTSKMSCSLGLGHSKQEKSWLFLCDGLESPGCLPCYENTQLSPSLHFPRSLGMVDRACFIWWVSSTGLHLVGFTWWASSTGLHLVGSSTRLHLLGFIHWASSAGLHPLGFIVIDTLLSSSSGSQE